MGQAELKTIYLSGVYMDLPKDEKLANDMMTTGVFCPSQTCSELKHKWNVFQVNVDTPVIGAEE